MPVKQSTTLDKIDKIENVQNRFLVNNITNFMDSTGASERHQNNNLKIIHYYVTYLGKTFFYLTLKVVIQSFLLLKQRKKPRMKTLMENGFQHGIITFIELSISLDGIIIVALTYYYQKQI